MTSFYEVVIMLHKFDFDDEYVIMLIILHLHSSA